MDTILNPKIKLDNIHESQIIFSYLGGSHLYGLNTEQSDIDQRFIFVNNKPSEILGLEKFAHYNKIDGEVDISGKELREFFSLLRKGNSEAVETLFIDLPNGKFPFFDYIQSYTEKLIDSDKLYSCIKGYAQSELKLALGERTGKLGSKRKANIDTYGFSPKNFVQLFRLLYCGAEFFSTGIFPTNVLKYDIFFAKRLIDIKKYPHNYSKYDLINKYNQMFLEFEQAYALTTVNYKFDVDLAAKIIGNIYRRMEICFI